jgi:hypothetical protein
MTMAKPKTELGQGCPPPPYTRWDQRGKPVLLSYLKRINGKSLCLSLETEDPEVAKRHMRLLVAMLLAKGRLSPDCGAAEAYGPKGTGRSRIEKFNTEVRRLTALSDAKYGAEALATAKRWGCPVGIIHHFGGRKPKLNAGTFATRRHRARMRGRMMPIGDTWEHRPQGGKYFFWNGKVLTARLQISGRTWQWPLKVIDEKKAGALMASVRAARERLRRAAVEELNCELGSDPALAAAAALSIARGQLAAAIIMAGGPKEVAEFVIKGPKARIGTPSPLPVAVALKATNQAKVKQCVEWVADLIRVNPDRPPVPLPELRKQAKLKFGVARRLFEEGNNCCLRQAQRVTKNINWRTGGRPPR